MTNPKILRDAESELEIQLAVNGPGHRETEHAAAIVEALRGQAAQDT
jgi:hypothetical protein